MSLPLVFSELNISWKRNLALILSLFLSLAGCASNASIRSSVSIGDIPGKYELTVPARLVVLRLPKDGFVVDIDRVGGGTNHPAYFKFVDDKAGIIISGWFEPASLYLGQKGNWEMHEMGRIRAGWPAPENVSMLDNNGWQVVLCSVPAVGTATRTLLPNMYANRVIGDTWIELHVSLYSYSEDSYDRLLSFLKRVEVEPRPKIDFQKNITD